MDPVLTVVGTVIEYSCFDDFGDGGLMLFDAVFKEDFGPFCKGERAEFLSLEVGMEGIRLAAYSNGSPEVALKSVPVRFEMVVGA